MGGAKKQRSKRAANRADDLLDQFDDMKGEILNKNKTVFINIGSTKQTTLIKISFSALFSC